MLAIILLFSHTRLAAFVFAALVAVPFFAFSVSLCHFLFSPPFSLPCHSHQCRPLCRFSARQQLVWPFIQGWTIFLLGCHFLFGLVITMFMLLLKILLLSLQGRRPVFFPFPAVFLVIFMPSCSHRWSYSHCSTDILLFFLSLYDTLLCRLYSCKKKVNTPTNLLSLQ